MINLCRTAAVICLWGFFQTHPLFACRYNVRETGFVDLAIRPYYLYCYVSQDTPADIISSFKQISRAVLMDSNIEAEIIDTDQQRDHPSMKYLDLGPIRSFPAAVLVSPDGQSLSVPITKPDQPFKLTLRSALDHLVSSPKREEILQEVIKTYGVVVLIEGTDPQDNKKAQEAVAEAIETISRQMEMMPKPIAHPPVLLVVDSRSIPGETILLWSLGLNVEEISEPRAAVLYGRARWIGPLMKGEEISAVNLTRILFVIGADCECGLDMQWIQGTMLPARWDAKMRARVVKTLEFDPENPMVKMEMSRILRRGTYFYPGVPLGYQELVAKSDSALAEGQLDSPVQSRNSASARSAAADTVSEKSALAVSGPALQKSLYFIAVITVLVIAAGLSIVFRAGGRSS